MFRFGQDIAASLKSITTITDLDLSGNYFGNEEAEARALQARGQVPDDPIDPWGPTPCGWPPSCCCACSQWPHTSLEHVKNMQPQSFSLLLSVKIGGHGVIAIMFGTKMKRLQASNFPLWFANQINRCLLVTVDDAAFIWLCSYSFTSEILYRTAFSIALMYLYLDR